MKSYNGTQSVQRAIQLLKHFDDNNPQWSLADLVETVGLNKTTVFRLLTALESEDLIRRTPSGNYRLGSEMIALGGRAMRSNDLRRISHDFLRELTRETGETTTLEVLREDRNGVWTALVIDEVLGRHLVGITQYIGSRLPVHATSTGKVLIAFRSPDFIEQVLQQPRPDLTEHTHSADTLRQELADIQANGVATAMGELEAGVMATAAPIFDMNGQTQAAISLVGPSIRITSGRLIELAERVRDTAARISYEMGYRK